MTKSLKECIKGDAENVVQVFGGVKQKGEVESNGKV